MILLGKEVSCTLRKRKEGSSVRIVRTLEPSLHTVFNYKGNLYHSRYYQPNSSALAGAANFPAANSENA